MALSVGKAKPRPHKFTALQVKEVSVVTEPAILSKEESEEGFGFPVAKHSDEIPLGLLSVAQKLELPEDIDLHVWLEQVVLAAKTFLAAELGSQDVMWFWPIKFMASNVLLADPWVDPWGEDVKVYRVHYEMSERQVKISGYETLTVVLSPDASGGEKITTKLFDITLEQLIALSKESGRSFLVELSPGGKGKLTLVQDQVGVNPLDMTKAVESASAEQRKNLPPAAYAAPFYANEDGDYTSSSSGEFLTSKSALPHHINTVESPGESSSVDLERLRNALARFDQVDWSKFGDSAESVKTKAKSHINKHAESLLESHKALIAAIEVVENAARSLPDAPAVKSVELEEGGVEIEALKTEVAQLRRRIAGRVTTDVDVLAPTVNKVAGDKTFGLFTSHFSRDALTQLSKRPH